jgi:hypothetical protein
MTAKPISYPSLVTAMNGLADVHAAIHSAVKGHAAAHSDSIAAKRKALELKHAAKKLLDADAHRSMNITENGHG